MLTLIFYLGAYTFGLVKALAGKPIWGLYAYFLCFYMHAPTQWWGQSLPNVRWALIAALITLISMFIHSSKRPIRFFEFRENWWLVALTAFVIAQTPFAKVPEWHNEYLFLLIKFLLFIFIVQNIVWTRKDVVGIVLINMFGGLYLANLGMNMHSGGRLEGIGTPGMESANQLGQHFAFLLFMGGYLLLDKIKIMHIFVAACLALIMMAMFLTESRGVLIGFAACGILAVFFIPKGSAPRFAVFGVMALVAGISLMGPQIIERFSAMQKDNVGEVADKSAGSRMVIINAQFEMFKASPLFGHGHQGTMALSQQYLPEEYLTTSKGVKVRASHNVVMAFLVDHGGIGAFLYFGTVASCLWRIWSVRKRPLYVNQEMQDEYARLSQILTGLLLGLCLLMIAGLGSNNKKLEGDIWVFALAPIVHFRMKRIMEKSKRKELSLYSEEENDY
jgi:O-antigen ligase